MDKPKKTEGNRQSQSYDTKRDMVNEHIRSEVNAYDISNTTNKTEELVSWIWCSGYHVQMYHRELVH
jgi:hypothetical protein